MDWLAAHDLGVLYWFGSWHRPWLDPVMVGLTKLGNPWVLVGFSAAVVLALALGRRYRYAAGFAAVALASGAVNFGTKLLVARPRPDVAWRLIDMPSYASFPSGHALCSLAIYATALALFGEVAGGRRWLGWVGVLLGVAIGLTRPYVGVHYPLDVVAGWVAGLGLAVAGTELIAGRGTPPTPLSTGTTVAPPAG
ncbi:MAG: phosphatase PAP2 family protein [Gemmataceae bacterium]